MAAHGNWLTPAEEAVWTSAVLLKMPLFAILGALWMGVHRLSVAYWPLEDMAVPAKSHRKWHNDVVASTHAWFALLAGAYALFVVGIPEGNEERPFATSNAFVVVSGVGFSYFFFDSCFIAVNSVLSNGGSMVYLHHFIFVAGYVVSTLYPASGHMREYYLFQLTELSTIFLQLNWFLDKAHVKGLPVTVNGWVLLLTFGLRCYINALAAYHANVHILRHDLWSFPTPPQLYAAFPHVPWGAVARIYVVMHSIFPVFMLGLNLYWYSILLRRAFAYLSGDKSANDTCRA